MEVDAKVSQVVAELAEKRDVKFDNTDTEIHLVVDGVLVFAAKPLKHSIKVAMLPDIFTYSTFPNEYRVGQIHFDGKGYLSVHFDLEKCDMGDVFEIIKDAITDLNLYGYKVTD